MIDSPIRVGQVAIHDEIHLSGGLRAATAKGGHLVFHQSTEGRSINLIHVKSKGQYYQAAKHFGFDIIGHEAHAVNEKGVQSIWNAFDIPTERIDIADAWSGIAYSAKKVGRQTAAETGRKIAFSLRTASLRLRDCSREYGRQNEVAIRDRIKDGLRFANIEIFDLYMALHSTLVEMCSARDYLARFIASEILNLDKEIDSMAGLSKAVSSKSLLQQSKDLQLLNVIRTMCDRTTDEGWMARLSEFRNIIAHRAPINNVAEDASLTANFREIGSMQAVSIYLGIPKDPIKSMDDDFVDALSHFIELSRNLRRFARLVLESSGFQIQFPQITDADLIFPSA